MHACSGRVQVLAPMTTPMLVVTLDTPPLDPVQIGSTDGTDFAATATVRRAERFLVALDLKKTRVCACETSSLLAVVCNQALEAGLKWFELERVSSGEKCDGKPKMQLRRVVVRLSTMHCQDVQGP